jgi:hypothetical protein
MIPVDKKILSPNFTRGRKAFKPEAIVIHIMEGTLSGTDSWFASKASQVSATVSILKNLNIRSKSPSITGKIESVAPIGSVLSYVGWVTNGQPINGNRKWSCF